MDWLGLSGEADGRIGIWRLEQPKDPPVESNISYATRINKLLKEGDFDSLESLVQEARKGENRYFYDGSPRLTFYYAVITGWGQGGVNWDERFESINKWKAAKPNSTAARIAEASLWNSYAWAARGSGFANTVTQSQWALFKERIDKARATLIEAHQVGEVDSDRYRLQVEMAKADPQDPEELLRAVAASIELDPTYHPTCDSAIEYLLPRWHGGPGDVARFANGIADLIGGDPGDMMYARMVTRAARYEGELVFERLGLDYERCKKGIAHIRKSFPMSDLWANWDLRLARAGGDREACLEIIANLDNRVDANVFRSPQQVASIHRWAMTKPAPRLVHRLRAHEGFEVWNVGWLKDDSELLSFGRAGAVKRWEPNTGEALGMIRPETKNSGSKMAVAANGEAVALVYTSNLKRTGFVEYLKLEDGRLISQGTRSERFSILGCSIAADGSKVATVTRDGRISVYPRPDMKDSITFETNNSNGDLALAADGKSIWTAGTSCRWSIEGKAVATLDEGGQPTLSPDGTKLALVQSEGVRFYSTDPLEMETQLDLGMEANCIAFSPDNRLVALSVPDGVGLYDLRSGDSMGKLQDPSLGKVLCLSFSHDGKRLAAGGYEGIVNIWIVSDLIKTEE